MTRSQTIGALLDATVRADPARPLLTYYDHAAGERVELSAATLDNWVAKTANLLADELDADVGCRVSVTLPCHWQSVVWLLACWRFGAVVVPQDARPDVAVVGPEALASGSLPRGAEVVATALHPMGSAGAAALPSGVTDFGRDVFSQADSFAPRTPLDPGAAAWEADAAVLDHAELLGLAAVRASELGLATGGRLASDAVPTSLAGALLIALVPLVVDGSVVLIRHLDPAKLTRVLATERVHVSAIGESAGR